MKDRKISIYDTTLRDGLQTPGIHIGIDDRVQIARILADLGVDVIEAGFPSASNFDFESSIKIARFFCNHGPIISCFAMANENSIDKAWQCVRYAKRRRVHLGLGLSKIHAWNKFKKEPKDLAEKICDATTYAQKYDWEIQVFFEDATRTDPDLLYQTVSSVIDAGASYINIPDTVGICDFDDYGRLIANLFRNVRGIDRTTIGCHTHDDLGMAVANAISGIRNGAGQIECTMLGFGERTGNANLISIAAIINEKEPTFSTNVDVQKFVFSAARIAKLAAVPIPQNMPIVGRNAFRTAAGLHLAGILREIRCPERPKDFTYLPFEPRKYGREIEICYKFLNGKEAIIHRLNELGFEDISTAQARHFYDLFIEIAQQDANAKKSWIEDRVFIDLANEIGLQQRQVDLV